MDCYLCGLEALTTAATGLCCDCNRGVCLRPSRRLDHVVHGDQCGCGCRKTVCEADVLNHATTHGKGVPGCFPGLAVVAGAPVVAGATQLSSDPNPDRAAAASTRATMTRFLNYITPGRTALWEARWTLGGQDWIQGSLADDGRLPDVLISSPFFSRARVERISALAAAVIAHGLAEADFSAISATLPSNSVRIFETLRDLRAPVSATKSWAITAIDAESVANHLRHWRRPADDVRRLAVFDIDFGHPATVELASAVLGVLDEPEPLVLGGSGRSRRR
jgi:hypothetical protein